MHLIREESNSRLIPNLGLIDYGPSEGITHELCRVGLNPVVLVLFVTN